MPSCAAGLTCHHYASKCIILQTRAVYARPVFASAQNQFVICQRKRDLVQFFHANDGPFVVLDRMTAFGRWPVKSAGSLRFRRKKTCMHAQQRAWSAASSWNKINGAAPPSGDLLLI